MNNKTVIWIASVVLALIIVGFWYANSEPAIVENGQQNNSTTTPSNIPSGNPTSTPTSTTSSNPTTTPPAPTVKSYTMTEVATRNSAENCWSVIDGNVYNLTPWISQHPGGRDAILSLCGKDGTTIFHGQHGNAQKQADILVTMNIGVLTQ